MTEKLGRNDLCSCGSGKKYKSCCMQKDQKKPMSLSGRKFTAKVLSAGGMTKQSTQQDSEQNKVMVDYNTLMERSFGDAIKSGQAEKPPIPTNPAQYLPKNENSSES